MATFATPPPPPFDPATTHRTSLEAAASTSVSASHHRPISLQSPADLLHLRATALRAARERIDLHLPPDAANDGSAGGSGKNDGATHGETEDMRRAVERMVDAWIERVFSGVREGVEVNGIRGVESVGWGGDADESNTTGKGKGKGKGAKGGALGEEYETYDTRLATRLTTLHARIESLNLALANTRREAVAASTASFQSDFDAWNAELTATEEGNEKSNGDTNTAGRMGDDMDIDAKEQLDLELDLAFEKQGRAEEVRRRFESAVGVLERLGKEVDPVQARAVEAEKVVRVLEGK